MGNVSSKRQKAIFASARASLSPRRLELPEEYILYVGTLEPRKNLPALVSSYQKLVEAGAISENLKGAAELVPPGNVEALADAMHRLLNDDALWCLNHLYPPSLPNRYPFEVW